MITLLGGGALDPADLHQALQLAPVLVAADGGANHALQAGVTPRAVIGDFDSISEQARTSLPQDALFRDPDQDSTDFDKCLSAIQAPMVLALGFLGARLDHQLAAFNTLVRFADQPCVLLGEQDLAFACPRQIELDLPPGSRFSLFPMGPVRGTSQGLRWPIEGLAFAPGGRIGTSNEVSAGPVRLQLDSTQMVVIVPRSALAAVLRAFGLAA